MSSFQSVIATPPLGAAIWQTAFYANQVAVNEASEAAANIGTPDDSDSLFNGYKPTHRWELHGAMFTTFDAATPQDSTYPITIAAPDTDSTTAGSDPAVAAYFAQLQAAESDEDVPATVPVPPEHVEAFWEQLSDLSMAEEEHTDEYAELLDVGGLPTLAWAKEAPTPLDAYLQDRFGNPELDENDPRDDFTLYAPSAAYMLPDDVSEAGMLLPRHPGVTRAVYHAAVDTPAAAKDPFCQTHCQGVPICCL
ncbi:hypothetical protein WJX72_009842 [[Myrmecia] bisecta]|uniref:Uncharacterized protein n=1 Tax=[Myrmecia] bisecta TaxID=41462 RepID=A0AAW1PPN2_9CHLO